MEPSLAIGDFARATHVSVRMLRHYHRIGLLAPAVVDPQTGYRRYRPDQIPAAQVIKRFRELDMPLDEIHGILSAPDVATRNELIAEHLARLEDGLAKTQNAVASLRGLLVDPVPALKVDRRNIAATRAAAITQTIGMDDAAAWYQGALGELHATLSAQAAPPSGTPGGMFSDELFTAERGQATMFIPCDHEIRPTGRVVQATVPAAELAVIVHKGTHAGIDRVYGALGAYVAEHAIAVEGPLREYYLVHRYDSPDSSTWRTEVGWPIFNTGSRDGSSETLLR
jgi:DNA-binding transcriptional MerR regulator